VGVGERIMRYCWHVGFLTLSAIQVYSNNEYISL
jgi:hypothetical protein